MQDQSTDPLEEWRAVVGYEGWYEVSDLGRVRRVRAGPGTRVGKILAPSPERKRGGYLDVTLSVNARHFRRKLHQLVAEAFIGAKPSPAHQVNHKDRCVTSNRATNLEWATGEQNVHHAARLGAYRAISKLTPPDVHAIRAARGSEKKGRGKRAGELAKRYEVHPDAIWRVWANRSWKHLPHQSTGTVANGASGASSQ